MLLLKIKDLKPIGTSFDFEWLEGAIGILIQRYRGLN